MLIHVCSSQGISRHAKMRADNNDRADYLQNEEAIYRDATKYQSLPANNRHSKQLSEGPLMAYVVMSFLTENGAKMPRIKKRYEHADTRKHNMAIIDNQQCRSICSYCREVLSIRWAALCRVQCKFRGQAYNACVIAWTELRNDIWS